MFESELKNHNVEFIKHDEMESLVNGMAFLLQFSKNPSFYFKMGEGKKQFSEEKLSFPKLLISIGSGVSIIKVNDYSSFQRVGGTMIGGGTLLGLSNLLTGVNDFDTINELALKGHNEGVDMLIKDIYGDKSPFSELTGDLLASSFAKVAFENTLDDKLIGNIDRSKYKKEDILSSLVFMISFNIG